MTITYNIVYSKDKIEKEAVKRDELRNDLLTASFGKAKPKPPVETKNPVLAPVPPKPEPVEEIAPPVAEKKEKKVEPVKEEISLDTMELLDPEAEQKMKELEDEMWKRSRPQLIKVAKKRNISVKGAKADLVERIMKDERKKLV